MTKRVDIDLPEAELVKLLREVRAGEDLVLEQNGIPVARVEPLRPRGPVQLGRLEGQVRVSEDFDAPLPDDMLDAFEGR